MSKPILSVIIPVYNTKLYLEQCLQSLAMQTLTNMEVIMVNDGSTDGSDELLKMQSVADSRFRYVEQINGGLSVARNTGMAIAQGTYIAFLDSDDWLLSESCLEIICRMADDTEADIIAGNTWSIYPDGSKMLWGKNCGDIFNSGSILNGGDFFIRMETQGCYVPMVYNYIYRLDFLRKQEFCFEPGLIHEDELWTPQVMTSARRVVYTDVSHYGYRQREGSIMTATSCERRINSLQIIINKLLEYISTYTNMEVNVEVVKKAIEINVLRLYRIACCLRQKDMYTTLYDEAGDILAVCENVLPQYQVGEWYQEHILLSMKDYFNELQEM